MSEAAGDDDIRLLERGSGIPVRQGQGTGEVVGPVLEDPGGAFCEGVVQVGDRGKRLVVDIDQLQRVLGDVAVLGDDGSDALAHPTDGVVSEGWRGGDALVRNRTPDDGHGPRDSCEVSPGDHVVDARQRLGLGDVDAHDSRMGEGAAQNCPLRHALDRDVIDELGMPTEQSGILRAQVGRARVLAFWGYGCACRFGCGCQDDLPGTG